MTRSSIAYIVFNRPKHTSLSFDIIRAQQPPKLFIIADGPRNAHSEDLKNCKAVRDILKKIDWPCEVYRNYSEYNLGLKQRVSSGLNWVFNHVDRAIILEDDCIAHPDFFKFCETLLDLYYEDIRVSAITGNNFQDGKWRGDASYYFSKYPHCWGWATWKRAWQQYKGNIPFWSEWSKSDAWLKHVTDKIERNNWEQIFKMVQEEKIDSWAYPWTASVWYKNGLTATPNINLVSNIGFGANSTHTKDKNSKSANMPTKELGALKHPKIIQINLEADRYTFDNHYNGKYSRYPYNLIYFPIRSMKYFYRKITNIYKK